MRTNASLVGLGLLLIAGAAHDGTLRQARAAESKASQHRQSDPDITGAVDARARALTSVAPVDAAASRARLARMRFVEARVAMDRRLLLRDVAPAEMAVLDADMKSLFDELSAIERVPQSPFANAAKAARDRADDWYEAGLKIIAPPASGVTELPSPVLMRIKADAVAMALDRLAEDASVRASAPSLAGFPKVRRVSMKSVAVRLAKPIDQNEASLRLLREGLPLFLPIAGNLINSSRQGDGGNRPGISQAR